MSLTGLIVILMYITVLVSGVCWGLISALESIVGFSDSLCLDKTMCV